MPFTSTGTVQTLHGTSVAFDPCWEISTNTSTDSTASPWISWTSDTSTASNTFTITTCTAPTWTVWTDGVELGAQGGPAKKRLQDQRRARVARALLEKVMSPEELRDWQQHRSVRVRGASGTLYEVTMQYVYPLDDDMNPTHKYCWHGINSFCEEDQILAIMAKLRFREDEFLRETHHNGWQEHERERVVLRRIGRRHAA